MAEDTLFKPIEWVPGGKVRYLDQTRLPQEEVWVETSDYRDVAEAIRTLQVRGAPLIGVAAAYALLLATLSKLDTDVDALGERVRNVAEELAATRPTAVNLTWALNRMLRSFEKTTDVVEARKDLIAEARRIHDEDIDANRRIGAHGAQLLRERAAVMTHCNAGALATGGYGTALGVIRTAYIERGLRQVFVPETRPLLQGARLTAWELARDGIPYTLIVDAAAGSTLRSGSIDAVIVGADRIAANGDVANKIGTYQHAVLAHENRVPFYVAAPTSTIDLALLSGDAIPIETRSGDEITSIRGVNIAANGGDALNPAFDVTPNIYVTAIVTENGVALPPYEESLREMCRAKEPVRG